MGDDNRDETFELDVGVEDLRAGGAYNSDADDSEEETLTEEQQLAAAKMAEITLKKKRKVSELKEVVNALKKNKKSKSSRDSDDGDDADGRSSEAEGPNRNSSSASCKLFTKKCLVDKETGRPLCMLELEHFIDGISAAPAAKANANADNVNAAPAPAVGAYPSCSFSSTVASAVPTWKKLPQGPGAHVDTRGCVQVLVLCSSALRASSVINSMSGLLRVPMAKLFAKHLKVPEQVQDLSRVSYPVAVGTPNRVLKLMELGALTPKHLQLVIVDNAEDTKHFTVLTQGEVARDFYSFMGKYVQPLASAGTCKVALVDSGKAIAEVLPAKNPQGKKRLPKGMGSSKRSGF